MSLKFNAPPVLIPMQKEGKPISDAWVQWFSSLYNSVSSIVGQLGGKDLSFPYGTFSSHTTQAIAAANTPQVCALTIADAANGLSLASNRVTAVDAGTYNFQFSIQLENTNASIADVWVWFRKNGVDVPESAFEWGVTSKHGTVNGYALAAANLFITLATGDYIQLVVASDLTGVNMEAYTSSTSPFTRPSIPSIILTAEFVSA